MGAVRHVPAIKMLDQSGGVVVLKRRGCDGDGVRWWNDRSSFKHVHSLLQGLVYILYNMVHIERESHITVMHGNDSSWCFNEDTTQVQIF